jgi:gamma-glutamylcyclotransferase (GGCT)/AIG2-like uncharacterized protein YtfP
MKTLKGGLKMGKKERQLVAVYGTLKQGYGNHYLLRNSKFIGYGITTEKFRLFDVGFPYCLEVKDEDDNRVVNVQVEVYEVDKDTFKRLDRLEGYPHHYKRKIIQIQVINVKEDKDGKIIPTKGKVINAWIYYIDKEPYYAEEIGHLSEYQTKLKVFNPKTKEFETIKYSYWSDDTLLEYIENLNFAKEYQKEKEIDMYKTIDW